MKKSFNIEYDRSSLLNADTQIPGGERVARFVYLVIFLSAHEAAVCGIGKSY